MTTFVIMWIGQLISMIGSGLTSFALGVWIFDQTQQATPFGLTVLFGSLPRLLLMPLAGSLADRWNRRWLLILSDTGNALVTLIAFVLLSLGDLQVWHIYLMSATGSIFSAFQEPAHAASIPMLVPKDQLGRANGMLSMGQALESMAAPLLAGVLFGLIGLRGIVLIDFITYFFAIGTLLWARIPQPQLPPQETGKKNTLMSDTLFGWQYLRQRAGLLGLLLYYASVNFALNWAAVLMLPLILSFAGPDSLGVAQMVFGLGSLCGGIVMSVWGGPKRRIPARRSSSGKSRPRCRAGFLPYAA